MEDNLHVEVAVLKRDMEHMNEKMEIMARQVATMHEVLTQARGARWAILTVVGISSFLAGMASWWISLSSGPK